VFWKLLVEEKYPSLRRCALNLTALFGSTYLCESVCVFERGRVFDVLCSGCVTTRKNVVRLVTAG